MTERDYPLAGRAVECAVIAEVLADLDDGRGTILQVPGEPGIGKSRMLRELCAGARARGHLVLAGRSAEFEAELPFGVFGDAVDDWLVGLERDHLAALAASSAEELAVVLPAFEAVASGRRQEVAQERYRAYRAVRGLLSQIAAETPVVLVLDDVQWADPDSVELICHLLAHPPRGAVLIALGFRPAQISARLAGALAAALRDHGARRLDLEPLSPAAAENLLGPELRGPVREQVYRESGGNPFFLLQLARGVTLRDRLPPAQDGFIPAVPETVRAALASELSSLSAPALVLLQGAAVTGDPFEAQLATVAADVSEVDALDLLDELLRFQLVYPAAVAGEYAFRHPIVRATVYELAAGAWRAHAHGRVAASLAARGASASARAPHVERSARAGDRDALGVLVAAAEANAPRAPALSARWYAAALRLLPESADAEAHRIELLIAIATSLGASGQLEASRSTLAEVLERLPPQDPSRVPLVAYCAGVEHLLGRHHDADARLVRAHRLQEDSGGVEAVLLKVEIAAGHAYQNRHEDMLAWAEQALEGATALDLPAAAAAAAGQIALAHYFLGFPADEVTDRAAAAFDALDDAELATRLDLGLWIGWTESVLERHDRAVEHCQRVVDVSRATGQGYALLVTMTAQAWALIRLGRLSEADEVLTAAIEAGEQAPGVYLSVALGLSASIATARGELERALRTGDEAVRLALAADPGLIPAMAGLHLAIPLIEAGEAQRARDIILTMSGGGELRTSRSGHAMAYEIMTRAELALGDLDAAERWARKAEAATHGGQLAGEAAFAHRAMAAVTLARGDARKAAELALSAARRAANARLPVEAGRCRILGASALIRDGRRAEALAELDRAAAELGRVGAHGYEAAAEKALRRLGRRTACRTARRAVARGQGLKSLTEREREIAELVRLGHTNREIAAAVYLSEKTVERRLSQIFAKLGVASRTALALQVSTGQGEDS